MADINDVFLKAYKKQLHNCRISAKRDFEEAKLNEDGFPVKYYRFETYTESINQITDTLKTQLKIVGEEFTDQYLTVLRKEIVMLYTWYALEIDKQGLEVNLNAIN